MRKEVNKVLIIIILILFALRQLILLEISPISDPDSHGYIEQIENLYNGNGFSIKDQVDNKIKPTAYRMPLFQYAVFKFTKLFFNSKERINESVKVINLISSNLLLISSFIIGYCLTSNMLVGLITLFLSLINLNILYNSTLILTDTFHSTIVSILLICLILATKKRIPILFFITGITIGMAVLTRPILKFYPVFLSIVIYVIFDRSRKSIIYSLCVLIGFSLTILPWIIRNYKMMNFIGLETNQGLNTLWSTSHLVEITEKDKRDLMIYEIKKIIIEERQKFPWPMEVEIKARKKLNLSEVEMSRYLQKIGIETILSHPLGFVRMFVRNLLNNITSATSELKMIDILFSKGYYNLQHSIMIRFENLEKSDKKDISFKEFLIILPNLIFRFIHLVTFVIAMIGGYLFIKEKRDVGIILLSFIWYVLILTSAVASYDRYRLPFEIILNFFISFAFIKVYEKLKETKSIIFENE